MPRFHPPDKGGNSGRPPVTKNPLPKYIEPRCHVCMSPLRHQIDKLIALGTNYTEISRFFELEGDPDQKIDRRSISNHAKKHLNYEEAAIQRIIEDEAQKLDANFEEGLQGALQRRTFLRTALQKAFSNLQDPNTIVEIKDAIQIVQLLEKLDEDTETTQIAELERQFQAFLQALREIVPEDYHPLIIDRVKDILGENEEKLELQQG